jgi:hypothetical protein
MSAEMRSGRPPSAVSSGADINVVVAGAAFAVVADAGLGKIVAGTGTTTSLPLNWAVPMCHRHR